MDLLRYWGKHAGRLEKQKSWENGLRIPVICSGHRHYRVSLNIQNATSTLQNYCESRPLGVNVNNLICIRPVPSQSKLSTVVPLDICLLNSRSICNKSWLINDFIADHNINLFALSETWLRGDDSALIRTPLNDDLSLAIDQFNSTLQSIIDNHAPIIRRSATLRPYAAWFTDEIKAAKTKRRKLER